MRKKMKKMDMIKLEDERTKLTLKLMNMKLIRGSEEHLKLREKLHKIHAIIKGEVIEEI
jgi:hypothetical protein